jgi:hypothetical protein
MSAREPVTDRYKGQVYRQDGLSPAEGEVKARTEGTRGSDALCEALWAAFERIARQHCITPDDARILLMGGIAL